MTRIKVVVIITTTVETTNYYKKNATQGIVVGKEVQQSRYASDPQYTLILEISFDSFGKTSATVLSEVPVRLSAYWAKILNQLSNDSLEKLSERAEELAELDNLKRNLEKKKDSE